MVVLEEAAEPLAADDFAAGLADRVIRLDDLVFEPLVISLGVIVADELADGVTEHLLTEEDHPVQTLFLDRPYPALGEGIQVGTSGRQTDWLDTGGFQDGPKLLGEFGVPVHEQVGFAFQESILAVGEVAGDLLHPSGIEGSRDAGDLHAARSDFDHEEDIKRDQAAKRPDLGREEIARGHRLGSRCCCWRFIQPARQASTRCTGDKEDMAWKKTEISILTAAGKRP